MQFHPRVAARAPALAASLLMLAACGHSATGFPSLAVRPGETPRVIAEPGAGIVPALSVEERTALASDIAREQRALDSILADMAAEKRALDAALSRLGRVEAGSVPWSAAQMALSRYDLARSQLADADARTTPLLRLVDSLPPDDADRRRVESLVSGIAAARAAGEAVMDAGSRRIGD